MSDRSAAAAIDRLPWLEDEPQGLPSIAHKTGMVGLWRWAVPALLLVAGISFWLGSRTAPGGDEFTPPVAEAPADAPAATTVTLPEPQAPVAAEQAAPAPEPEVVALSPAVPAAPRAAPPAVRHGRAVTRGTAAAKPKGKAAGRKSAPTATKLQYWPAWVSAGASGRMVRIGTFATSGQAKKGWRGVVKIYPGIKHIPAVVVPLRSLRDGRTYYRLQMGTTSQAHSEVLCQRMRIIGQSCIVIGLQKRAAAAR